MSTKVKAPIKLVLSVATVFPDLNESLQKAHDFAHETILVHPMKHRHFRQMEKLSDNEKIHYLMQELTGLTQRDIDELDIDDSAELTQIIIGFMKKYVEISKQLTR